MAENSKIEWTHHTVNLWWGCTAVHAGCDNCYAETLSNRWGKNVWGNDNARQATKSWANDLDRYQQKAKFANEVHRVFIGSMMDIFEKPMPMVDYKGNEITGHSPQKPFYTSILRDLLFDLITRNKYPNLMFLFLTKRPSNINKFIPESWIENPPQNVMYGASISDQATADTLLPQLLKVKGNRYLSIEPQLGSIDIKKHLWANTGQYCYDCGDPAKTPCDNVMCQFKPISWVIVGGESGAKKRPYNADWARSLRDQCKATGVPFFMKQMDKIQPIPEDLQIREFYDQDIKISL
jgi:protein gp37